MADCTQLQDLLNGVEQELAALNHPIAFCQNECDPSAPDYIICLKACLRSIPEKKAADAAAIVRLQDEIHFCGILLKTWNLNANGFTGTLTITSLTGNITDTTFGFTGTLLISGEASDSIIGAWDELGQLLTFTRFGNVVQDYTGFVSTNPSTPNTLAGTFTSEDSPGKTFGWFATP